MTVIAAFKISDTPVLIGDILLSQTGSQESHIEIPTSDEVSSVLPEEWMRTVTGLYPKLALINPSLAIGWTGQAFAARALIREIRARFELPVFNPDEFFSFLRNNEILDETVDLTIIGWVVNSGEPVSFCWNTKDFNLIKTEGIYIEGSGETKFKEQMKNTVKTTEPATMTNIQSARLGALKLVSSLLTEEILFGNSTQDLFGGGYQVIVFDQGQFTFLDDYIFMPMQYEEKSHEGRVFLRLTRPRYVIKHKYINNTLIISRSAIDRPQHPLNKVFLVRDVQNEDKELSTDEKNSMLSLEAKYYTLVPFLMDLVGDIVMFQIFSVPTSDKKWIYMKKNGELVMKPQLVKFLTEEFQRAMRKKYSQLEIV